MSHAFRLLVVILAACLAAGCSRETAAENQSAGTPEKKPQSELKLGENALLVEEKVVNGEAISTADVAGFAADELRILRNACFARHGRKYDSPGLGDYFSKRAWYKPRDDYADTQLTETDKANVKAILAAESNLGANSNTAPPQQEASPLPPSAIAPPPPPPADAPSEGAARRVFENYTRDIPIMFSPPLTLVVKTFRKTDGQQILASGVKKYKFYFEAVVDCPRNEYVNMFNVRGAPYHLGFGGSRKKGQETIRGFMLFERTERGWRGEDGNLY